MKQFKQRDILITLAAIGLTTFGGLGSFNWTSGTDSTGLGNTTQLALQPAIGQEATSPSPVFRDASVHDPSVIKVGDTFYVFGSHLAAAKSKDFLQWDKVADGVNADNPLFDNVLEELKEAFDWSQNHSLWAADVIQLADGRFYMYYNAAKGDSPRSALGIAVADKVEGPYKNQGLLLKSGMWGQPSEDGTIYDARRHPNAVDPDVFFDNDGQLWMLYGSYSGGLYILRMDEKTGRPLAGQGYGKRLIGANHAAIEGGYVLYHPQTKFYYMFASFGGLAAASGYNMRVARSERPDGPYLDAEGVDMANVKADPTKPLFDDRSIEPFGVKLMGNFLFERKVGEVGTGIGTGYVSPGHNSAYYDPATGKQFLIFHARFPFQGEGHQIRVHQMFMNAEGWPVVAPHRYAGETNAPIPINEEVAGSYRYINHGKAISAAINKSQFIRFATDGSISGAASGTWKRTGPNGIDISLNGQSYSGVFARGWEPDLARYVLTFSALSKKGVAIWGSKMSVKTDAQVVADVKQALDVGDTSNSIITSLILPTEGTQGSRIAWTSTDPQVISTEGVVSRPPAGAGNAKATLTATITQGEAKATKTFAFTVKEKSSGGLVAHYAFDSNLNDSRNGSAKVTPTGNRIDNTGGAITFALGVRGDAALFDGSSGVLLPKGLIAGDAYSVALWVKPTQLTDFTTVFFGAKDPENWVTLMPRGHGGANNDTMIWARSATFADASTGLKIPQDQWTHLAFTVQEGVVRVYVNGTQRFQGTNFPNIFTTTTGTFGLGVNFWDAPFKGLMDEVRVYESAITAQDVATLAQQPRP